MNIEKLREEFEAWVAPFSKERLYSYPNSVLKRDGDNYATTWVDSMWIGWQASREALVIELPEYWEYDSPGEVIPVLKDCRKAIEAAGLKVSQ